MSKARALLVEISLAAFICVAANIVFALDALAAPAGPGGQQDLVDLDRIPDFSFVTWASGDGTQRATQLNCAASADTNRGSPGPGANQLPYNFKVTDLAATAGYRLYLNDDQTNTGNATVAVQFRHRDVKAGSGYQQLTDDVYDTHGHNGQFKHCRDGDNSALELTINSMELTRARAGTYTGNFEANIRGGIGGTTTDAETFRATIAVAPMVRISSLDNIDLGSWSGSGNVSGVETFCVYSNNATAAYNMTITSPNQDATGFHIVNSDGSGQVPYTLWFNDSTGSGNGTTVGATAIAGTGDNTTIDCGGLDNARLTVSVAEADLQSASADIYGDTLTLLVSPE